MKKVILFLKFAFPVIFFFFLFRYRDVNIQAIFDNIHLSSLPAIVFFQYLSIFILSLGSFLILRCFNISLTAPHLFALNIRSFFYSLAVPGQFGGMVYRWYQIAYQGDKKAEALFYIVLERYLDILTCFFVALIVLIFYNPFGQILLWGIGGGFLTFLLLLICHRQILNWLKGYLTKWSFGLLTILVNQISKLSKGLERISFFAFFEIVILFLLNRLLYAIIYFLIFQAVGIFLPFAGAIWMSVLIYVAQYLPISFLNLGVREGLLIYFLGRVGVSIESSLSVGAYILFLIIMSAGIGGIMEFGEVYLKRRTV